MRHGLRRAPLVLVSRLPTGAAGVLPLPGGARRPLVGEALVPQHRVWELPARRFPADGAGVPRRSPGLLHRSVTPELLGRGRLETVFCCTALGEQDLRAALPQFKALRRSKARGGAWLGVARRARGPPDGNASLLEGPAHALYLVERTPPFKLLAVSVEFCVALDGGLAMARGGEAGELRLGGPGLRACDPELRVSSVLGTGSL